MISERNNIAWYSFDMAEEPRKRFDVLRYETEEIENTNMDFNTSSLHKKINKISKMKRISRKILAF